MPDLDEAQDSFPFSPEGQYLGHLLVSGDDISSPTPRAADVHAPHNVVGARGSLPLKLSL